MTETNDAEAKAKTDSPPLSPVELADRLVPDRVAISPDGRLIAIVVAPSGSAGEPRSTIWWSRDGAPAEPCTSGLTKDRSPTWSPDSQTMAFISNRQDSTDGIYLLKANGGEAQRLGTLSGKLSQLAWSPDGSLLALRRLDDAPLHDGNDAVVVDSNPRYQRIWIVDVANGSARQLSFGKREIRSIAWSSDGQSIYAISSDAPGEDALNRPSQIIALPVTGGAPRTISTHPVTPSFLTTVPGPNGEILAMRANLGRATPANSVWTAPASGRPLTDVLPNYPGTVEHISPIPNKPSTVLIQLQQYLHTNAFILDLHRGELTPVATGPQQDDGALVYGASISADSSRIAMLWSDGNKPDELYAGDTGAKLNRLTDFGKQFECRLQPVKSIRWQSDEHEIEGLLTLPNGYEPGQRYPLVVEIHGGPSHAWADSCFLDWHDWAQLLASHGFAVLAPNPRGSSGRGSDFERLLQDDVGGGEMRDILAGVDSLIAEGIADLDRLGIGGWSWGGFLAARTITKTQRFKAAVVGAGVYNLISDHGQSDIPLANLRYFPGLPYNHWEAYADPSPLHAIRNVTTPTLILHGEADTRVQVAQSVELHRALKMLDVPVEFVRYPREEHSFKERAHQVDLMERMLGWFNRWL